MVTTIKAPQFWGNFGASSYQFSSMPWRSENDPRFDGVAHPRGRYGRWIKRVLNKQLLLGKYTSWQGYSMKRKREAHYQMLKRVKDNPFDWRKRQWKPEYVAH